MVKPDLGHIGCFLAPLAGTSSPTLCHARSRNYANHGPRSILILPAASSIQALPHFPSHHHEDINTFTPTSTTLSHMRRIHSSALQQRHRHRRKRRRRRSMQHARHPSLHPSLLWSAFRIVSFKITETHAIRFGPRHTDQEKRDTSTTAPHH